MKQEGLITSLPAEEISIPSGHLLTRLPLPAALVGAAAMAVSIFLGMTQTERFFQSYLVAFLFFVTLALGGLFFVLLQFVTRAGWSVAVRRVAEQVMSTLPLMLLLFVPLAFGVHQIWEWSHQEAVAADHLLQHKQPYLNETFFYLRSVVFLVVWAAMGWWFRKESIRQDETRDPHITRRLQSASAPALLVFAITLTLASIDWIMSVAPHWYSTIFGVYVFGGCVVAILSFLILLLLLLQKTNRLTNLVTMEHFHDLGKLLFGFVVFWAYIAFSQFMLMWYANIPEETLWFAHRWQHGWQPVSIGLAVGHFVLPFFFLLPVATKRRKTTLTGICIWLLAMHYLDLYWLVMPNLTESFQPHLLDALTLLGTGGIFVAWLAMVMRRPALVPLHDPRLAESLTFENV